MARRAWFLNAALALVVVAVLAGVGTYVYRQWQESQQQDMAAADSSKSGAKQDGATPVRVSAEARKNMSLLAKPLQVTSYLRRIDVPGVITDRPGVSDRGVVAPVT